MIRLFFLVENQKTFHRLHFLRKSIHFLVRVTAIQTMVAKLVNRKLLRFDQRLSYICNILKELAYARLHGVRRLTQT